RKGFVDHFAFFSIDLFFLPAPLLFGPSRPLTRFFGNTFSFFAVEFLRFFLSQRNVILGDMPPIGLPVFGAVKDVVHARLSLLRFAFRIDRDLGFLRRIGILAQQ